MRHSISPFLKPITLILATTFSVSSNTSTSQNATLFVSRQTFAIAVILPLGGEMKEMKHSNPAKSRYDGCVSAFQNLNLSFDAKKQFEATHFTMEGGYQAMGRLMDKMSDLTAVFVMSDVMALGAIRAVRDRGLRVPDDISVIGFDGIEMGQYLVPKLTTIQQPGFDLAERCVDILLQCICENKPAVNETVPFYFIEGESAKAL